MSRARLWYVPLSLADSDRVPPVPPMTYASQEAEARGRRAYEQQRADRLRKASEPCLTSLMANSLNLLSGHSPGK